MKSKKESMVTKDLAKRIKYYWSCVLNQLRHLDVEEDWELIETKVKAPLEHLYNEHRYCDVEWCYALQAKRDNHQYIPPPNKPFYSKDEDGKMFKQLEQALLRFKEKSMVKDCLHQNNTQMNESLNLRISKYAPKNKHFGASTSLDTRISTVVAVVNMGYTEFYNTLIDQSLNKFN